MRNLLIVIFKFKIGMKERGDADKTRKTQNKSRKGTVRDSKKKTIGARATVIVTSPWPKTSLNRRLSWPPETGIATF